MVHSIPKNFQKFQMFFVPSGTAVPVCKEQFWLRHSDDSVLVDLQLTDVLYVQYVIFSQFYLYFTKKYFQSYHKTFAALLPLWQEIYTLVDGTNFFWSNGFNYRIVLLKNNCMLGLCKKFYHIIGGEYLQGEHLVLFMS